MSVKSRYLLRVVLVIITIVGGFSLWIGARFVLNKRSCDYLSENPVWSPDAKWALTSSMRACPVGLLDVTNYDVFVDLSEPTSTKTVRILEEDDANELPTIDWRNTNEAIIKLMAFGTVSISKNEFANVKLRYVVPQWIWHNLENSETYYEQEKRSDDELFKAGKMSGHDLQTAHHIHEDAAAEDRKFREWIVNNAIVDNGEASPLDSR
jgi:hypothetical protein